MNINTITTAQVIKAKSRLKGIGLLGEKDSLLFGVFIASMESKDVSALTKENLIDIWHLIQFCEFLDKNQTQIKYKNNKRIFLD